MQARVLQTADLPLPTEHGERSVASVEIATPVDTVYRVLCAVDCWSAWNPMIEWSSVQIRQPDQSDFSVLSGRTLLSAQLRRIDDKHFLHYRCIHPQSPQPPAADFCVRLGEREPGMTVAVADACLESWFRDRLNAALPSLPSNIAFALLRALQRAVERPGAALQLALARLGPPALRKSG